MSTADFNISGIANRYASALYELADSSKALDDVAADLTSLKRMIESSSELASLVRSPVFSRAEKQKAMMAILDKAGAKSLTKNFIGVVIEHRRLYAVLAVIRAFTDMLARRRGQVSAEVVSAQPLSPEQVKKVEDVFRIALSREVDMDISVDPSLIGGMVVKFGSRMIDFSLKTKLQNLQVAMRGAD